MKEFTIYCTPEQTKRAYKLGAPIITVNYTPDYIRLYPQVADMRGMRKSHLDIIEQNENGIIAGHTPTAEQMRGWLRKKGVNIDIISHSNFYIVMYKNMVSNGCSIRFDTHEDAELASIDVALDYLEKGE